MGGLSCLWFVNRGGTGKSIPMSMFSWGGYVLVLCLVRGMEKARIDNRSRSLRNHPVGHARQPIWPSSSFLSYGHICARCPASAHHFHPNLGLAVHGHHRRADIPGLGPARHGSIYSHLPWLQPCPWLALPALASPAMAASTLACHATWLESRENSPLWPLPSIRGITWLESR
jgi:hypothetical protein